MEDAIQRLKCVDDRSGKIVSGYFHGSETSVLHKSQTIPEGIINLCLLYYWLTEQFDDELHGQHTSITDEDRKIAKKRLYIKDDDVDSDNSNATEWESIFGTLVINDTLYPDATIEWTINLVIGDDPGISVGIISVHDCNAKLVNANCFIGNFSDYVDLKVYGLYISGNYHILDTHDYDARCHELYIYILSILYLIHYPII